MRERRRERLPELLADSKHDLTNAFPHDAIVRCDTTTPTLAFQPRLVLDDFLNHRQLLEEDRITGIHDGCSGITAYDVRSSLIISVPTHFRRCRTKVERPHPRKKKPKCYRVLEPAEERAFVQANPGKINTFESEFRTLIQIKSHTG
jgi:hypothetical protein